MADLQNEIDLILQAAATRILPVELPSNYTVPWTGVTSKPPILGETATITSSNYTTYMGAQSVSVMAYSNTYGGTQSTISTSLSLDSDAQNVLLHLGVTLVTTASDSVGGRCNVYYNLYINGALYRTRNMVHLPNMSTAFAAMVQTVAIVYIPTPPDGIVVYQVDYIPYFDGDGTGGSIQNGSIEAIGLHV